MKKTIKITKDHKSQIWKHAREIIGGFRMELELGERSSGGQYYFNRYQPEDQNDGADLCDFKQFDDIVGMDVELAERGVLLDFYVYNIQPDGFRQLNGNVLVEFNEHAVITRVFETGCDDRDIRWTNPNPRPLLHHTGIKTIDNLPYKYKKMIESISDERRSGDGFWIYLHPEFADFAFDPWCPFFTIHEQTITECLDRLKQDCRRITEADKKNPKFSWENNPA